MTTVNNKGIVYEILMLLITKAFCFMSPSPASPSSDDPESNSPPTFVNYQDGQYQETNTKCTRYRGYYGIDIYADQVQLLCVHAPRVHL